MSGKERQMFRSAVFVAIKNENDEYLLQRRTNTGFMDGYYDLASGHLEHGESCEQAAVREAEEELGLKISPNDLELVATFQSYFEPDINYLNLIFRARKFQGVPVIGEPDKIDHIGWFHPDNFPEKLTPGTRIFLKAIDEGVVGNYFIDADEYFALMGESYE